jgi:hypothetical protein
MKLELVVLAGAALIAGSILFIGRYEISAGDGAVHRLDRWTGEIEYCGLGFDGKTAPLNGRVLVSCRLPVKNQ